MAMFMAMLILWGITVWYIDKKEKERDAEWCELIVTFDNAYKTSPPTSETGKRIAELMDARRRSLGC